MMGDEDFCWVEFDRASRSRSSDAGSWQYADEPIYVSRECRGHTWLLPPGHETCRMIDFWVLHVRFKLCATVFSPLGPSCSCSCNSGPFFFDTF